MADTMVTVHNTAELSRPVMSSVVCILSPCRQAARGLAGLLKTPGRGSRAEVIVTSADSPEEDTALVKAIPADRQMLVFIPREPVYALYMLKLLALSLSRAAPFAHICVMSHFSAPWLYRTLQRLSGRKVLPHNLISARANLPCRRLHDLFGGKNPPLSLRQQAVAEEKEAGRRAEALTARELDAALEYLSGSRIRNPSVMSFKTLYAQRRSGLAKLMAQLPSAAESLPLKLRKPSLRGKERGLQPSAEELIFGQAIRDGQVFPVFQPVVDRNMRVQGFEVLTRWLRDGRVVMPAEFLPLIRTRHTWLLLTAFVIHAAVQRINQFAGELYFAVNVPSCVAESRSLFRMAETARARLRDRGWADRLVLEFSESTDLNRDTDTQLTIREMRDAGYRIFLDDCFSLASVMFPVRQVQFSGYKLDMSVTGTFLENRHDENLIRGLVYYCQLTGSQCIAEGVDTWEKFNALADMGVSSFQGFYISPPVTGGELEEVVLRSGANVQMTGGDQTL
ncbi:TPA: EAL domain-containing protein [Enterobacter cloacae]|nr:EAL domain-containing protein [Enterobacter cloacae]